MKKRSSLKTKFQIMLPIGLFSIAFIYIFFTVILIPLRPHHIIGGLLTLLSFVLWIAARLHRWDARTEIESEGHLLTTGVYSKFRHPIYYFSVLAAVGVNIFLWTPKITPFVILLAYIVVKKIKKEDTMLAREYGRKYRGYKRRTWF